jgi:hypothetical protein
MTSHILKIKDRMMRINDDRYQIKNERVLHKLINDQNSPLKIDNCK